MSEISHWTAQDAAQAEARAETMRWHLDQTPMGEGYRRPGMGRAYHSLSNAAYDYFLTFEELKNSTPKELARKMARVKNCGPKTIKLICESLGIVEKGGGKDGMSDTPAADEKKVLALFADGGTYNDTPPLMVNQPQPMPTGGVGPDIFDLVIADFRERNELGLRTYGAALRAHDGRINDIDLYQELLDAVVYMRKRLEEHKRTPFNCFARDVHAANRHWWVCPRCEGTGRSALSLSGDCLFCEGTGIDNREVPKLLMLTVSELAEAMEGDRKDLMDDKLPHRKMFEVEIADTFIRLFDLAGRHNLDLDGAIREKMEYNRGRKDHKPEARKATGGKRY